MQQLSALILNSCDAILGEAATVWYGNESVPDVCYIAPSIVFEM